ncbi:hypothetical protein B0H11DRAFT_2207296 [Mycena galericulata]|nr:hypothetical protein B0H11DRAFT_2207296 [Mycena galericulata]
MSTDAHVNSVFNQYTAGSLYFLPSVVGNATNLGLWDSTLYEVPDVNTGSGNVTVAAIGFNITCGYLTHVMDQFTYDDSHASWQANWTSDDANALLKSPIHCLHNPVNQTAVVEAQSRQIQVVEPDIRKSFSTWQPYAGPSHNLTVDGIFDMASHRFPLFNKIAPVAPSNLYSNIANLYLLQRLNLFPLNSVENESTQVTANVTLHDVENAVLGAFCGPWFGLVAAGLIASIILLFLSLPFGGLQNDTELPITELGVLHTIWLYRNHPELESLLLQVEHPTTQNLREAGLVPTRLAESNSEQRRICQSFELEGNLCAVKLNEDVACNAQKRTRQTLTPVYQSTAPPIYNSALNFGFCAFDSRRDNKRTSLIITIISTTFGTTFAALLVFVTQKLWMRHTVPASITGVLSALFYLGTILTLHITTPALFSLATFTSPSRINVQTQGLPDFNRSVIDLALMNGSVASRTSESWLDEYTAGSLYFLPSVSGNATNLGLWDSTLYEVPDVNTGSGNVTVAAIGFNITCGYPTQVVDEFTYTDTYGGGWLGNWMSAEANQTLSIINTQSGMITPIYPGTGVLLQSTMFFSTIPIVDSNNCLHNPVNQTAVVDAQSRQIQVVEPDVRKSASTWQPYVGPSHDLTVESIFDMFPLFYSNAPDGQYFMAVNSDFVPNAADMYLFQKLDPLGFWENNSAKATAHATLHDVENALSELFAAMVWTVGNVPPPYGSVNNCSNISCTDYDVNPFILLSGNAAAMGNNYTSTFGSGLTASIILLFLSLLFRVPANDTELPITELGVLHTIWLYRNHPEVETLLSAGRTPDYREPTQGRPCVHPACRKPFTLADFGPDFDLDFDF